MYIIGNFIMAIAVVGGMVLKALALLIIVRAILSWFSPDPYNQLVIILNRITEPVLMPFRRIIPPYGIGIDLSPILAFLFIKFLEIFLINSLQQLALSLR